MSIEEEAAILYEELQELRDFLERQGETDDDFFRLAQRLEGVMQVDEASFLKFYQEMDPKERTKNLMEVRNLNRRNATFEAEWD